MKRALDDGSLLAPGVPIDLDNCAREPIHIPGSIQPRGVLVAVRELTMTVTQVSANLEDVTGADAAGAVGRTLREVLGPVVAATVEAATDVFGDLRQRNPHDVVIEIDGRSEHFDVILHRAPDAILLIELERASGPRPFSFPHTYLAVRGAVADLNKAADLTELYEITARAVRELTGFDRFMVYRYDHEFNGEVVAEEKQADLEPFLGLHYPASDIPAQARALYEKNWIRLISDVDYQPSALTPSLDPTTGHPLDLTLSTLRSVSPIHLEYLTNMGVRASMSISLLRHGVLWGLIACHHYSGPHTPPYSVRTAAEFLGSTLSLRLVDRAEEDELRTALAAQSVLARLTSATLDGVEPLVDALVGSPSLLDLFPADGVAVAAEGRTATLGTVPDSGTVIAIAEWARSSGDDLVATDSIAIAAPQIAVSPAQVSGVLALPLPDDQHIVWFRIEASHAVDWAGDPSTKAVIASDGDGRLSPRASFARWREIVELRSEPWTPSHEQLALDLGSHIVEALYIRSKEGLRLAEILNGASCLPAYPSCRAGVSPVATKRRKVAKVGGDWYDALMSGDDTLTLVVGDVAGYGIAAAGIMAQLRNALRAYLFLSASPAEALDQLNDFTIELLPSAFATVVAVSIHLPTGRVRAASAGHLAPLLTVRGGQAIPAPIGLSPPIGVPSRGRTDSEFTVAPRSGLIFFSDGLVERRTENLDVGLGRLATALGRLQPQPDAAEIFAAVAEAGADDDATVLAVHRTS